MNILIIAGEVSGDLYASKLATALKENNPTCTIYGIGGQKLKSNCDHFIFESAYSHGIGLSQQFHKKKFKKNLLTSIYNTISTTSITKAIIIDFQHYNTLIAKTLQQKSIQIHTFITPNFWMWKAHKQAAKIKQYSHHIFTIFKKEYDFYKKDHNNVYYFGHPLSELCQPPKKVPHKNKLLITFFPGSRKQEFDLYLSKMIKSIKPISILYPEAEFQISVSAKQFENKITKVLKKYKPPKTTITHCPTKELLNKTDILISASGSATLEAILYNIPLLVLAALPPITYFFARYIIRVNLNYIALPNFLVNQDIIPELVQHKITVQNIVKKLSHLINNKENILKKYTIVKDNISKKPNIFDNIAKKIITS
ncbi:hypothetical protein DID76_02830 [Candidatus Marinamargulisbacteria bacterium SCGC AG-414-C22]|nr:hypothetical protein DID76_02830 [Candidatus Marinamargulisbacteria bacterium SCGC AG-414-C22]